MRQKAGTSSSVPDPLSNQMLDYLEGYLNNISAAATQAVGNGGPLMEFSVSLAVSVDTVADQAKEIKRLYEHINALKKKGTLTSSSRTTEGGGTAGNVCPHCAVVRRLSPQKNNACYFDLKKMTNRREWYRKLMKKRECHARTTIDDRGQKTSST